VSRLLSVITPSSLPLTAVLDGRGEVPAAAEAGKVRRRAETAARTARLLGEWFDLVWRVLVRFGVPPDSAEDAAQEVFLIASNKLDEIEPEAERRFLYAVAVRVAANSRRALGTRREVALEPFERVLASSGSEPDVLVEQKRAREVLERVLDSMPEELRTVFVLFELEELTGPEVAEVLGVPLGTTASRLRRAREHFQAAIARLRESLAGGGAP